MHSLSADVAELDGLIEADLDGSTSATARLEVQLKRVARQVHATPRGAARVKPELVPLRRPNAGYRCRILRQLLARHGVTLSYDPAGAWQLTAQPPHRPASQAVERNA